MAKLSGQPEIPSLNLAATQVSNPPLPALHHYKIKSPFSGRSRISHREGVDLVGGRGLPRRLRFVKFVCQNERIGSLGGAHAGCAP